MNNNAKLNLNGIFGFNKLLVGKVNVEPDITNNTVDIKYIYNNVLTSLQNQITTTVRNALNASEVITTINSTLNSFQTNLTNQITKEAGDVSNLQGQINSNYTTIDNKYSQLVTNLSANQAGLQTQINTLSTTQANSNINTNNAYTWKGAQTFTGGVSITGGLTTITRDMTIGANENRILTVNSSPTFNSGLTVASGSVSFPSKSIDASCIANIPTGISVSNAYTWKEIQTFQKGISTNGETNTGSITVSGDTTLGTSDANSLTINATPVISSTPTFNKGLNVVNGPVYFPSQSISSECVVGLLSVSNSNTWNQSQTFKGGLYVNGSSILNSVYLQSDDIIIGKNTGSSIVVKASPTFQNGFTVSSGAISIPNNALPIASISGLNTKLNTLESSISSQVAKEASDFSNLQLQITNISTTPGATGAKGDKGDTGPAGKDGANGKDGINGTNGKDGINGKDGANGLNGLNGVKGDTGDSGASQLGIENKWTALQTFDSGINVSGGSVSIARDTTIGVNSNRLLTVNASATFNSGLKVASGKVSIPDGSLPIQAVDNLSNLLDNLTTVHNNLYGYVMNILRAIPNTWTSLQTFTNGIKVSGGLTVPTGETVSFPANSIPSTCISGLTTSSGLTSNDLPTVKASTQVGYQIGGFFTAPSGVIKGSKQLCSISGLTPIGSVWIIEMFQQQATNANYQNSYYIELQAGTTYANNSGNQGNGKNIMTIYRTANQTQQAIQIWQSTDSQTCVYVVPNDTGKSLVMGAYANSATTASGMQFASVFLQATRIA